jgi:DNA-binding transcriptional LysR family regulator
MSTLATIDPDLLRSFAFVAEERSFTRAAERVGRTQSAVSMQMQRLETVLGQKLLLRGKGGSVQLTPHGNFLLDRSRELLAMNDQIWSAFRSPAMHGTLRLGTPDDYALRYLPTILKRFADSHPGVDVDVLCESSSSLRERLLHGDLDLTLISEGSEPAHWPATELWRGKLLWITSQRHTPHRQDPLPLALARKGCIWRAAAIGALERAGRHARVAYTSATQVGTHAPVLAGLAVTVSTISWVPEGLRIVRTDEGLPELPEFGILLVKGRTPNQPLTDILAAHITETFRQEMRRQDRAA